MANSTIPVILNVFWKITRLGFASPNVPKVTPSGAIFERRQGIALNVSQRSAMNSHGNVIACGKRADRIEKRESSLQGRLQAFLLSRDLDLLL